MKNKNPQSKAHVFRKRLTEKPASQKRLEAKLESGKIPFGEYFRRRFKPVKHGLAEFLCNKASLQNVLKEAEAMVLNESESDANRVEAHKVKTSIKNALTANTTGHAAQLAFIAGLRWMQIFWAKSLKSPGVDRYGEWEYIRQVASHFPKLKKIEIIRRGLQKFELHTGKKAREEIYFQKKFASILK